MHQWCISFTKFETALRVQRLSFFDDKLTLDSLSFIATSLVAYHEFPLQKIFTSVVPNWRTIITKKFTYCFKYSWPHIRFPNLRNSKGLGIPRQSDFEGQQDLITELPQDWRKETLGRHKQNLVCTRTQGKGAVTPQETEPDLLLSVWGSPAEVWDGSGLPWGQGHWQQQSCRL